MNSEVNYGRFNPAWSGVFGVGYRYPGGHIWGRFVTDPVQQAQQTFKDVRKFVSTKLLLRARTLFIVPIPLFFMGVYSTFTGSAMEMVGRFGGFALFFLAAWLLVEGQKAEHAYNEREVAKPPAFPRKLFATITTGLAVAVTSLFGFEPMMNDPANAAIYSLAAALLHSISFGLDPMSAKGLDGYSPNEAKRLLEALERGERLMQETLAASKSFSNYALQQQVQRLVAEASSIFRAIEKDPRDLHRARKFMYVYLQGARDATVKLAKLKAHGSTAEVNDYQQLLSDLQTRFIRQKETLLQNDRSDLDVEVEVLRERIKQDI